MYESAALCQEFSGVSFLFFLRKSIQGRTRSHAPESDVVVQRGELETSGNSHFTYKRFFSLAAVGLPERVGSVAHLLVLAVSS